MSFYIKMAILLIIGTFGAQYAITKLVFTTADLPKSFNHKYVERTTKAPEGFGMQPKQRAEVAKDLDAELAEAISARNERLAREQEGRSGGSAGEIQRRSSMPVAPIVPMSPDAQSGGSSQPASSSARAARANANNDTEAQRVDSDADMRVRGNLRSNDIKANAKPERAKITRASTQTTVKKVKKLVLALDLAYAPPIQNNCAIPGNRPVVVGVNYRTSSYAIKGESLTSIDQLIRLYKKCDGGTMLLIPKPEGLVGREERLIQQRQDEVKYYLLQRHVKKADIIYANES